MLGLFRDFKFHFTFHTCSPVNRNKLHLEHKVSDTIPAENVSMAKA